MGLRKALGLMGVEDSRFLDSIPILVRLNAFVTEPVGGCLVNRRTSFKLRDVQSMNEEEPLAGAGGGAGGGRRLPLSQTAYVCPPLTRFVAAAALLTGASHCLFKSV